VIDTRGWLTILEVYDLCVDKAMVEDALQQEHEKLRLHQAKLDNLQAEYKVMMQNCTESIET